MFARRCLIALLIIASMTATVLAEPPGPVNLGPSALDIDQPMLSQIPDREIVRRPEDDLMALLIEDVNAGYAQNAVGNAGVAAGRPDPVLSGLTANPAIHNRIRGASSSKAQ